MFRKKRKAINYHLLTVQRINHSVMYTIYFYNTEQPDDWIDQLGTSIQYKTRMRLTKDSSYTMQ